MSILTRIAFYAEALSCPKSPLRLWDNATDVFSSLPGITTDVLPVGIDTYVFICLHFSLAKQLFHAISIKWIITREKLIFHPVKLVWIAWRHFNLLRLPSQNSSSSSATVSHRYTGYCTSFRIPSHSSIHFFWTSLFPTVFVLSSLCSSLL
jgi:hypothetical protein